ncbi:unnamed protein product, partial [Rotaria sp. Silwood2]
IINTHFPLELERYYKKDKRTLLNILCKKILTISNSDNQLRRQYNVIYHLNIYLVVCLTDELAVFDFTSTAVCQQQNDLHKIQSNSLTENSFPEISFHTQGDDRPTLIEGTDNELETNFIDIEIDELNRHSCMIPMICLLKHMETNRIKSFTINFQNEMPP